MGITVRHIQHHAGGRKSFRRQIPNALRKAVGKTQIRVSLGLPNSPGFLSRYELASAQYDRELATARRKAEGTFHLLTPELIEFLLKSLKSAHLEDDEWARWEPRPSDRKREARERLRASCVGDLGEAVELRALGDIGAIMAQWADTAEQHADLWGFTLDRTAPEFVAYVRAYHDAQIEVWRTILQRLEGADIPTPPSPAAPSTEPINPSERAGPAVPIMATFDAYAADRAVSPRIYREWRSAVERLTTHVGHDDAKRLTADDLRGWRNSLAIEPSSRTGLLRSPVTIRNKYLRPVKTMLEWAVQEGKLETNAAYRVTVTTPRRQKLREKDFTKAEAHAILAATLLAAPDRMTEGHRMARRWIPWLCAYSGARVGEIAQLRGQDFAEVDGIWRYRITPEAGTVKTQEAREVPLHAHLIDQGFLDIVKAKGSGPIFYDPAQVRVEREGNRHVDKVGERLAKWVREGVGITDKGIKPNHAWRHTFKTIGAEAGLGDRVLDDIEGHSPGTVGAGYQRSTLKAMSDALARFPRFEVPLSYSEGVTLPRR